MSTTNVTNHGGAVVTPTLPLLLGDPTTGTWSAGETKAIDDSFTALLAQFSAVGAQFDQGKALVKRDTFKRDDDSAWGTASDSTDDVPDVWTTTHPASDTNTATLYHKAGKYVAAGASHGPLSLLGDPLETADMEALVRCKATAVSGAVGAGVVLRSASDFTSYAWLEVLRDGTSKLTITNGAVVDDVPTPPEVTNNDDDGGDWAGVKTGRAFWVRFQVIDADYKWRVWPDAVSEPVDWTGTFTSALTLTGLSVGLYATMAAAANVVEYDHYSVFTIS